MGVARPEPQRMPVRLLAQPCIVAAARQHGISGSLTKCPVVWFWTEAVALSRLVAICGKTSARASRPRDPQLDRL